MTKREALTVERVFPSGAWAVSAIVRGDLFEHRHCETFYGYTKREAVALYLEEFGDRIV